MEFTSIFCTSLLNTWLFDFWHPNIKTIGWQKNVLIENSVGLGYSVQIAVHKFMKLQK